MRIAGHLPPKRRACYFPAMSTLAEIEAAVEALPKPDQEKLFHRLAARLHIQELTTQTRGGGSRVLGLHSGAWEVSPDFDAPLPDEFWMGRDA